MIRSINFKLVRHDFQKELTKDINNITSSENLLIFADKTTNLDEITPEQYKTILTNNVTKTYRKAERSAEPAFISLKDHKKNFKHNTKCRLINPCKGEMDVLGKKFLEELNNKLNNHLRCNQWCSTYRVI